MYWLAVVTEHGELDFQTEHENAKDAMKLAWELKPELIEGWEIQIFHNETGCIQDAKMVVKMEADGAETYYRPERGDNYNIE